MLHTVNKSPFEKDSLESCLKFAKGGSTLLLIEDGVYAVLQNTSVSDSVQKAMENITVCALGPDLKTRGIADKVMDGIKIVDYSGFVDLTAENDKVQAWL
jgi:tRNA 2-thiouridine synthesizing protein B